MKNYCLVGTGGRGILMYGRSLIRSYGRHARLTGLCDSNPGRVRSAQRELGADIPGFTDFDLMLRTVPCDVVIVCSRDDTHHEYIVRSLKQGKDVIAEKPMAIDADACRDIMETERLTGRKVTVTFNYRFVPYVMKIKQLLDSGAIGDIHSIDFQWFLDTVHGASYYRRWNSRKARSGGLLVHKSAHHFDLINWWLDRSPETVFALGARNVYGDRGAIRGKRCSSCAEQLQCPFHYPIENDRWTYGLYVEHEKEDGYIRDQCVFDPAIDIEDTMSVLVRYRGGVQLNYTLVSYAPFEGWKLGINGSKGRLEAFKADKYVVEDSPNFSERSSSRVRQTIDWRTVREGERPDPVTFDEVKIYPVFGGMSSHRVEKISGGHEGGDERLLNMLFVPGAEDPDRLTAGAREGAMAALIGIAANRSIACGLPVVIDDSIHGFMAK